MTQIRENASAKAIIYIVGNKIDDKEKRVVTKEEGEKMSNEFNLKFFEASAKEDINIAPTFEGLVKDIYLTNGSEEEKSSHCVLW